MDVRCARCQTEYELDDESVSEAGATVQCTTCGHTFVVSRGETPPPVGQVPSPITMPAPSHTSGSHPRTSGSHPELGPAPADWLLQTIDGQFHRFRELTTLQKWIIERKVTRGDLISRTGQ